MCGTRVRCTRAMRENVIYEAEEFIVADAIVAELQATDRDGAIRELVTSLATAGALAAGRGR